jgi:hypothetical protein
VTSIQKNGQPQVELAADRGDRLEPDMIPNGDLIANDSNDGVAKIFNSETRSLEGRRVAHKKTPVGDRGLCCKVKRQPVLSRRLQFSLGFGSDEPHLDDAIVGFRLNAVDDCADDADADATQ